MKHRYAAMVAIVLLLAVAMHLYSRARLRDIQIMVGRVGVGMTAAQLDPILEELRSAAVLVGNAQGNRGRILLAYSGTFVYGHWEIDMDQGRVVAVK